jgi:hypothetical protein
MLRRPTTKAGAIPLDPEPRVKRKSPPPRFVSRGPGRWSGAGGDPRCNPLSRVLKYHMPPRGRGFPWGRAALQEIEPR